MSDVMISYSRKDSTFVRQLHQKLSDSKREGWVDWEGIPLTADWWQEICRAIESADTFLFVISPDSLASPVCQLEVDHARHHNKRLVPIVRRSADPADAFGTLAALPIEANMQARLGGRDLIVIARDNWNALARHNWLKFDQDSEFEANFQKLITALDMDLDYIHQHTRLLVRAKEWENAKRIGAALLRDEELALAQQWLATSGGKNPSPSEIQTQYIFESAQEQHRVDLAEREQQARELLLQKRAANRLRYLVAGLALFLVVAIGLSIFAFNQFTRAQDEANNRATQQSKAVAAAATADRRAIESQSLFWAGASQELTTAGDGVGLVLALEAASIENPPGEAQRDLAEAAYAPGIVYEFPIHTIRGDPSADAVATSLVNFSTLSADGNWVAADFYDESRAQSFIMIWDVQHRSRHDIAIPTADGASFKAAHFNPVDATQLAMFVTNGDVLLVDRDSGTVLQTYRKDGYLGEQMVFGSNGHLFIVMRGPTDTIVWDATEDVILGRVNPNIEGNEFLSNYTFPLALSANGQRLAYVDTENFLRVVNLSDGRAVYTGDSPIETFEQYPNILVLSDDGSFLAITNIYSTLQMIDVFNHEVLFTFNWNQGGIDTGDFDATGQTFAAGAWDGLSGLPSLYVWDVESGVVLLASAGSLDVDHVTLSDDGQYLLTSTNQITRRNNLVLWAVRPADVVASYSADLLTTATWALHYTPDGTGVAFTYTTTTRAGEITRTAMMDILTGTVAPEIDTPTVAPDDLSIDLSTDGQISATIEDGTLVMQNAAGATLGTWPSPNNDVRVVVPQNQGTQVAIGGCDEYINVSTAECGRGKILIYSVGSSEPRILPAHAGAVTALAWSPDGRYLASGGEDNLVILWDMQSGEAIRYWRGHQDDIGHIAYSPTGDTVASLDQEGTAYIWRVDTLPDFIAWVRANRYVRELTCNERLQYRIQPYCPADYVVPTSTPFMR